MQVDQEGGDAVGFGLLCDLLVPAFAARERLPGCRIHLELDAALAGFAVGHRVVQVVAQVQPATRRAEHRDLFMELRIDLRGELAREVVDAGGKRSV